MTGYYYLHTNGQLIFKRFEPEQEPGGFVRHVWAVDTSNRMDAWRILLESLALGADVDRVDEIAAGWKCDSRDLVIYMCKAHRSPGGPSQLAKAGLPIFLDRIIDVEPDTWLEWLRSQGYSDEIDWTTEPKREEAGA